MLGNNSANNIAAETICLNFFKLQLLRAILRTPIVGDQAFQVPEGKEFVITLPVDVDNCDFGIELTGGRHTYLGSICIQKIYNDSAAYKDGRLKRGDIVLSVNGKSMKRSSLDDAKRELTNTSRPLQMSILRDPDPITLFTSTEDPKIFVTVELWKNHANEPLGISLLERKNVGVFVTWINPDSPAGKSKRIRQGDKIVDINGRPAKGMDQAQEAEYSVVIVFGRIPTLFTAVQEWARDTHGCVGVQRTFTWSHSELNAVRQHRSRKTDDGSGYRKQSRRFSAFNLRLRSNSTHVERLAVHGVYQKP